MMTVLTLILVLTGAKASQAHGTHGYSDPASSGVRIVAAYDDGEPMRYCKVEITAPDTEIAFQSGYTDRNGLFLFAPDQPGRWRIAVHDGMGHRLSISHEAAESSQENHTNQKTGQAEVLPTGLSRCQSVLAGLGIIFGASGWIYGLRRKLSV